MAKKNPKLVKLEEELRKAELRADNEKEIRIRLEGKLEKFEEKDDEDDRLRMVQRNSEREYQHQLEDQVLWLRRLVENLSIPKDKLELINRAREEVNINGGDFQMEPQFRRNK